eukprot:COSAG05_NODE_2424_length_3078_cov_7.739174_2_plen_92_part_00
MVTPSHFKILANTVFDIYLAGMVRQPFNLSDIVFLKDHARDADNVAPQTPYAHRRSAVRVVVAQDARVQAGSSCPSLLRSVDTSAPPSLFK